MFGNTLLIFNPTARSGKAHATLSKIAEFFDELANIGSDHRYEIIETERSRHAVDIVREMGSQFDSVFVLGGDGIVHEAVNGLMQIPAGARPKFGVLPAGQGNDFARSLNLPINPMKVFKNAEKLHLATIDVGCVNGVYFAETLSFGVDAAIGLETMERRKNTSKTGTILYVESGFNQIVNHLSTIEARVVFDGGAPKELRFFTFAIQNGNTYGGGFNITPKARIDDGLLNICYATPPLSKLGAVKLFLKAKQGKHVNSPNVHFETARNIKLTFTKPVPAQIDGEEIDGLEFNVEVIPSALRVFCF